MDRRTFLKATAAAATVVSMPAVPASGADGPKPWRDLVDWCNAIPNIKGYLTGVWTPEYEIGEGTMWVGRANSLIIAPTYSPEEACAAMKAAISNYVNASDAVWWRMLPSLRAFWYVNEGAISTVDVRDRVALLERPHYTLWCRIAAFGADRSGRAVRKGGFELPADRYEKIKARCGVVDTIFFDPWKSWQTFPAKEWSAPPPPGATMCDGAVSWASEQSEWTTGKVRMSKPYTGGDKFAFIEGA